MYKFAASCWSSDTLKSSSSSVVSDCLLSILFSSSSDMMASGLGLALVVVGLFPFLLAFAVKSAQLTIRSLFCADQDRNFIFWVGSSAPRTFLCLLSTAAVRDCMQSCALQARRPEAAAVCRCSQLSWSWRRLRWKPLTFSS